MAIAVVNYPAFSRDDYGWLQSVRRRHDPLYFDIVDPHLTLVFPTDNISELEFIDHVREHAKAFSAFEAVFRCAILGDPSFQEHAHAFLVPDEGFSDVVRLHDRLYTGLLEKELRLDLPFVPHVGIANTPTAAACKVIIDELNAQAFEIRARVETLNVIGYDGKRVWNIEQVHLADAPDFN